MPDASPSAHGGPDVPAIPSDDGGPEVPAIPSGDVGAIVASRATAAVGAPAAAGAEPRRSWVAWAASGLLFVGAGVAIAGLLVAMWTAITDFPGAAWLNQQFPFELGSPLRILPTIALWIFAVATGAAASISAYYAWAGYRWARWAALIAVGVGLTTLMINWLAPWCLLPLALGAGLLWTPPARAHFLAWDAHHHPASSSSPRTDAVEYGPLARYR